MPGNKKKVGISLGIVAGVVLIGIVALVVFFPTDFIRDRVVASIEGKLQRPVSVGGIHMTIFPHLGADITDVRIGERAEPGRPLLAVASLNVRVRPLPLLRREVEITSVEMDGLDVQVILAGPGDATAPSPKTQPSKSHPAATPGSSRPTKRADDTRGAEGSLAPEGATAESSPTGEGGRRLQFKINALTVRDGRLSVGKPDGSRLLELGGISEDLNAEATSEGDLRLAGRTKVDSLRIHLPAGDLGQGMKLRLQKKLHYSRTSDSLFIETADLDLNGLPVSIRGRAGLVSSGHPTVDMRLEGGPAEVSDILGYLPSTMFPMMEGIQSKGTVSIEASVNGPAASEVPSSGGRKRDFRVVLKLSDGRVAHPGLAAPIEGISLNATVTPAVADITEFTAVSGTSRIQARAKISDYGRAPAVDAALDADLDLQEVAAMRIRPGIPQLQGRAKATLSARGPAKDLNRLDIAGILDLHSVRVEDARLAAPLEDLNGRVLIHGKDLTLQELTGKTGSSDFSVRGALSNYRALQPGAESQGQAKVDMSLTSHMLALDELMSRPEARQPSGTNSGEAGPASAKTPTPPAIAAAPLAGLAGTVEFRADRVRTKEMETGAASGLATIDGGLIRIERLDVRAFGGDVALQGTVDLRSKTPLFDMKAQVQKASASDLLTSLKSLNSFSRMGGFLTGEIDAQATLRGNLNEAKNLDLGSITSIGDIAIHQAKVSNHPLQVPIANFLEAPQLKNLAISDWFQPFRIENGRLIVENLSIKAAQVEVSASGWQSLDGKVQMDFEILLPQELSAGVRKQIPKELVPVLFDGTGSSLLVPVRLSGSYDSPRVAVDSGRLTAEARVQAQKKLDAERQRLEEEARSRAQGFLDDLVKTPTDTASTKQKASEVEKKIKKSLKDLFKKK